MHTLHLFIWLWLCHLCDTLLTLTPHRDFHLTSDLHGLFQAYFMSDDSHTIHIRYFDRLWLGTPSKADLWTMEPDLAALAATPIPPLLREPHAVMWEKLHVDYIPSNHPSHIICTLPTDPTLLLAILATAKCQNRLISSTIFWFAVAHCFNTDYSNKFCPRVDDHTTCPCVDLPRPNPHYPHRRPTRHTWNHVIFHCPLMAAHHIPRVHTLRTILQSKVLTATLCKFL